MLMSSDSRLVLPSCLEIVDSHKCDIVEKLGEPGLSEGSEPDELVHVAGEVCDLAGKLLVDAGGVG